MKYFVYILECRDGSFYTGIARDLEKRVALHNLGKGSKYTMGRGPVNLRYSEEIEGRSAATQREMAIKKLSKKQKIILME